MKIYNKDNLHYKNGMFVTDSGDIIGIDSEIVDLANELETKYQRAVWLETQPAPCLGPNFSEFERLSEFDMDDEFKVETPIMDKRTEESIKYMEELDMKILNDSMNEQLRGMKPLVMFVEDDSVISFDVDKIHRFDCYMLGNPLDWTKDTIISAIARINNVELEDDGEQE